MISWLRLAPIRRPLRSKSKPEIPKSKIRVDASGDLVVEAEGGEVRFHKPVVYQATADAVNPKSQIQNRKLLDGRYVLTADNQIHFEISNYDKTRPLVIDPVLVYSTYLGGGSGTNGDFANEAYGIAVDPNGNAYVTGQTCATDFPTTSGAFEPSNPGAATFVTCTAFVTKLNPKGSALVYSTYLGGSTGGGFATAIAADAAGNAYVTGLTVATDFP